MQAAQAHARKTTLFFAEGGACRLQATLRYAWECGTKPDVISARAWVFCGNVCDKSPVLFRHKRIKPGDGNGKLTDAKTCDHSG